MRKIIAGIGIVFVCLAAVWIASMLQKPANTGMRRIKVVTTLFPLYDMAKNIGGDKAEVSLLLPPGVEAHSFEPKPSDVIRINEADIFVYTGKFMEPWAEDILMGAVNRNLIVVDASKSTKMIPRVSRGDENEAGSLDPHIWLDLDNARIMVANISSAFEARDGVNRNFYEQETKSYTNKLSELDSAYRMSLSRCKGREIIYAGHYAFSYLANRYGLRYRAAQGVSPNAEPTANDLVELVEQIRKDKIKYVFYEELTSPRIAETIAGETHARMLLLNAAHNLSRDQFERGISFFDILKNNLDNLKIGLDCR